MALPIALRGSAGIWMVNGPPNIGSPIPFPSETSGRCKVMVYSKDGGLFAWCNGDRTRIVETKSFNIVADLDKPKASCLTFSPKGTYLIVWELYTVDKESRVGVPNLHIFDVASGKCLKSLIQKSVIGWAPQFSDDEKICCRNVTNELHFFEDGNFDQIKTKLHLQKVAGYSLAVAGPPYMVACYVPGDKGQPSFARVYRYPNFEGHNSVIANRTFFKADKIEMQWNKAGTAMLLLTTTDTSESSYYGDQGLHFVAVKGESSLVHLGRNGPVYHVEWSPKSTEFCVVYGFMPAKATIYNLKTEPVFDFGTGPRNFSFYNPQGSILCLCGFGNLRGNMEFWDVKQKKLICQTQSQDTTSFQWCVDGEHIITATTAPRLRVANGYRIWHYTGTMLHEQSIDKPTELWEAYWQPAPVAQFPEKSITYKPVLSEISTPVPPAATAQAYVPPSLRGQQNKASTKLHEYELPSNAKQSSADNGKVSENKKKRDAKKAKEIAQKGSAASEQVSQQQTNPRSLQTPTGNPELNKKIRNIKKKLEQIEKLKEQVAAGKQLEKNQVEKIKAEESLLSELEKLEIS